MINNYKPSVLLPFIDYTYLDYDKAHLNELIKISLDLKLASICVYPEFISTVRANCSHRVTTVLNFPSGEQNIKQIQQDILKAQDADEIDIVFPYKTYLSGLKDKSFQQMEAILQRLPNNKIIKIIVESGLYKTPAQLQEVCQFLTMQDIAFIKTSTGKVTAGATIPAAQLILEVIQNTKIGLKVSGGIQSPEQAWEYYLLAKNALPNISPDRFRIGASRLVKALIE